MRRDVDSHGKHAGVSARTMIHDEQTTSLLRPGYQQQYTMLNRNSTQQIQTHTTDVAIPKDLGLST